jgi:hypothetical protein
MAIFKTIIIDRRLYIDDGRGLILIDTSSLASFHKDGSYCIDDITCNVENRIKVFARVHCQIH